MGIDVLPEVLALAAQEVTDAGLGDRIELRQQSVADLDDHAAHDVVWIPQAFVARPAFEIGLRRLVEAVTPGGGLVAPLAAPPEDAPALARALSEHHAHVLGGGPMSGAEARAIAAAAGWTDVVVTRVAGTAVLTARGPGG